MTKVKAARGTIKQVKVTALKVWQSIAGEETYNLVMFINSKFQMSLAATKKKHGLIHSRMAKLLVTSTDQEISA